MDSEIKLTLKLVIALDSLILDTEYDSRRKFMWGFLLLLCESKVNSKFGPCT